MQDLAIVGMGLIGSAALRHAARSATVIGIGPTEPQDRADHAGPYASHFDAGRITRRLDVRREWSVLASRAIAEYPTIEARSGIAFHHPAGLVYARHDREG
ncbi:MAG: FAD-dependent oxidoreductase, partial [Actinomycetota bacterium]